MRQCLTLTLLATLMLLGCERAERFEKPPAAVSATDVQRTASLYDLRLTLTDQDGRSLGLDAFKGQPVIISMFYASCPYACPTLISDIQRFERKLEPNVRSQVRVLLVSFDSERDTPEALKKLAHERKLELSRWKLASASSDQVRELAAVLGLKYRRLENGEFNHSSVIALLDGRGVIAERVEGLSQPSDALVDRARLLVQSVRQL